MKREFYDKLNKPILVDCFSVADNSLSVTSFDMGIAAGGSMHQEIYKDPYSFNAWDLRQTERCFVTIANAGQWIDYTGEEPPLSPIGAHEYTSAGLPWFKYYGGDQETIDGAKKLGKIKTIKEIKPKSGANFWTDSSPVPNPKVVQLGRREVNIGEW